MTQVVDLHWPAGPGARISLGCLYNDAAQFENMAAHLEAAGFRAAGAELMAIDNGQSNKADCFDGIRAFLAQAQAEILVVLHQDVEVIDDHDALLAALEALPEDWAVAGNVGYLDPEQQVFRITDPYREDGRSPDLPAPVTSLDENFLVLRRDRGVTPSWDLEGFHFYGTDLCLQARLKGCTAWVIDYHVRHLSRGKVSESFYGARAAFEAKYEAYLKTQRLRTPSAMLLFGAWAPLRPWRQKVQGLFNKLRTGKAPPGGPRG